MNEGELGRHTSQLTLVYVVLYTRPLHHYQSNILALPLSLVEYSMDLAMCALSLPESCQTTELQVKIVPKVTCASVASQRYMGPHGRNHAYAPFTGTNRTAVYNKSCTKSIPRYTPQAPTSLD